MSSILRTVGIDISVRMLSTGLPKLNGRWRPPDRSLQRLFAQSDERFHGGHYGGLRRSCTPIRWSTGRWWTDSVSGRRTLPA